MPLNLFNQQRKADIPRFSFSSPFSKDGTCYKSGPFFKTLEKRESNNTVKTIFVINFSLKALVLTILTFEVVHNRKAIYL